MNGPSTEAPASPLEMPFILKVTAAILILSAAQSLVETAETLILHKGRLNFGCLITLPLGWSMLRGARHAHVWLAVTAGIWLAGLLYWGLRSGLSNGDQQAVAAWKGFQIAVMLVLTVWLLLSLWTSRVRKWFCGSTFRRPSLGGWGLILLGAGILYETNAALARHQAELHQVFQVATTVSVTNGATGTALDHVACSVSGGTEFQRVSTSFRANGSQVRLTGTSDIPVSVMFEKDGFEPGFIILDARSPTLMALQLTPRRIL